MCLTDVALEEASDKVYNDFLDNHFCTGSSHIRIVGKFNRSYGLVLVVVDVFFRIWDLSAVVSLGVRIRMSAMPSVLLMVWGMSLRTEMSRFMNFIPS